MSELKEAERWCQQDPDRSLRYWRHHSEGWLWSAAVTRTSYGTYVADRSFMAGHSTTMASGATPLEAIDMCERLLAGENLMDVVKSRGHSAPAAKAHTEGEEKAKE